MDSDDITNRQIRRRQRLLAGAIFAALAVFAVGAIVVTEPTQKERKVSEPTVFSIRPEHADRETLIARYDAKILALTRDIEAIRAEAKEREKKLRTTILVQEKELDGRTKSLAGIEEMAKRLGYLPKQNETPEETEARLKALEEREADVLYVAALRERFGSEIPGPVIRADRPKRMTEVTLPDTSSPEAYPHADVTDVSAAPATGGSRPVPVDINGRPIKRLSMVQIEQAAEKPADTQKIERKTMAVKRDEALALNRVPGSTVTDYIPAGAFVQGRVLTGLYAATGAGASGAALPMLIRLENLAQLPNAWKTNVKSCHLTASATGDLSSERVFVRLDRLACIGRTGEVLDVQVKGYLVGSDGKVGLRGKLVTRSGQAIASALSVGLLSGIGNAVTRSNEEIETSILGTQTKRYTNAWLSGLGDGMADAMDRITDYYLKLADRIFPVLEVEAGRRVDVVFSQGVLLTDEVK